MRSGRLDFLPQHEIGPDSGPKKSVVMKGFVQDIESFMVKNIAELIAAMQNGTNVKPMCASEQSTSS